MGSSWSLVDAWQAYKLKRNLKGFGSYLGIKVGEAWKGVVCICEFEFEFGCWAQISNSTSTIQSLIQNSLEFWI